MDSFLSGEKVIVVLNLEKKRIKTVESVGDIGGAIRRAPIGPVKMNKLPIESDDSFSPFCTDRLSFQLAPTMITPSD